MPWTVMSDAEVAEVLRTDATVHESGDAGQMLGDPLADDSERHHPHEDDPEVRGDPSGELDRGHDEHARIENGATAAHVSVTDTDAPVGLMLVVV